MKDSNLKLEKVSQMDSLNIRRRPGYRWGCYSSIQDVILDYGRHYKIGGDLNEYPWCGVKRSCYANAFRLASLYTGLEYVEGFYTPPPSGLPFMHAWCVTRENLVIDPTLPIGSHYFGMPFPLGGVRKLHIRTGRYGVFETLWLYKHCHQAA